jgi:hypothetical protein
VEKDYITERLQFLTALFKLLWLSTLAIGGGTVGILLGPVDLVRYAWAAAGMSLTFASVLLIWLTHRKMQYLWRELRHIGGA